MRALIPLLLVGCHTSSNNPDARVIVVVDSPKPDAMPDAKPDAPPPDAPSGPIGMACADVCHALATCLNMPDNPSCVSGCSTDLADCTTEQVQAVEDCHTQACGTDPSMGPLVQCIQAVACVNG